MTTGQSFIHRIGCVSPHGLGLDALVGAAKRGTGCPRNAAPAVAEEAGEAGKAGWVASLSRPERWCGRRLRFSRLDRTCQLALVAAAEGQLDSAVEGNGAGGVALGTAHGAHLANERFQRALRGGGPSPALFAYTLASSAAAELSIHLGLKGPAMTFAQGEGAGIAALGTATRWVERGQAPLVLAGAVETLSRTLLRARGGLLAEGALLLLIGREPRGARGRVVATSHGGNVDQVVSDLLRRARLDRAAIRFRWGVDAAEDRPLSRVFGDAPAVAPLWALALALSDRRRLPALIVGQQDSAVDAICVTGVEDPR